MSLHFIRAAGNNTVPRRASPLVGTSAVGSVVSVLHGGLRVCRSFLAGCSRGWLVQCKVHCATLAARSRSAEALGERDQLEIMCVTAHDSNLQVQLLRPSLGWFHGLLTTVYHYL